MRQMGLSGSISGEWDSVASRQIAREGVQSISSIGPAASSGFFQVGDARHRRLKPSTRSSVTASLPSACHVGNNPMGKCAAPDFGAGPHGKHRAPSSSGPGAKR